MPCTVVLRLAVSGALAAASLTGVTLTAPPAAATVVTSGVGNGPGDALVGDVTGDGVDDRTTLGSAGRRGCKAVVRPGLASGGLGAPVTHLYAVPDAGPGPYSCPDMGTVLESVDATADRIALTWFGGSSPNGHSIVVLRRFEPVYTADGELFPSRIGTADFDGDVRPDVWEHTDEGEGLRTLLTRSTGLVPGPVRLDEQDGRTGLLFADLNHDGATDVVAVVPGESSAFAGVIAISGRTGAQVPLERYDVETPLVATVADINRDGFDDVRVTGGTETRRLYLNAGRGPLRFVAAQPPVGTSA